MAPRISLSRPQLQLLRLLLAAAVLLGPAHQCAGDVLASSSLESCVQSSSTDISCRKKMVVTLTVDNTQALATQQLQLQLACVASSTGACPCPCNRLTDSTCKCADLETPLTLAIAKTPMWATYPMQYLQSFNYKPYEVVVRPPDNICLDGAYEPSPTCGWYWAKGVKVPDSQGFTCVCSSSLIWDTTLGGTNLRTRANLDCDFWSNPLDILLGDPPCSAHCLEFDPLWYSGYQLGSASMQFTINITLAVPTNSSGSSGGGVVYSQESLHLGPTVPLALSTDRVVSAKLLGDLATYTQLPAVSNMILLIPQPSGWGPDQILASNRSQWLLLDRSALSLDGSACDKVGTSFAAFRYQPSACARAPQVCLTNQIKDLLESDATRIAAGKTPLHSLSRYTYGSDSTLKSFTAGALSFALPVTSTSTSLVVLSVSADSMRFVTNTAPGVITGMQLCTFNRVVCGGFEAGASRGYLSMNVTNTGQLAAEFTITLSNCSTNVLPVEARKMSLAPGVRTPLLPPLELYVSDSDAVLDRYCWVTLYNSQGLVSDRAQLRFYTNATVIDEAPSGGYNGTGDGIGTAGGAVRCSEVCGNAADVFCFLKNRCWKRFGGFLGVTIGSIAGIALLALAAKTGLLSSACGALSSLSPCGGGSAGGGGGGGPKLAADAAANTHHNRQPRGSLAAGGWQPGPGRPLTQLELAYLAAAYPGPQYPAAPPWQHHPHAAGAPLAGPQPQPLWGSPKVKASGVLRQAPSIVGADPAGLIPAVHYHHPQPPHLSQPYRGSSMSAARPQPGSPTSATTLPASLGHAGRGSLAAPGGSPPRRGP